MNLGGHDVGKEFIAPSGRRVRLVSARDNHYVFDYIDDPSDGLALSSEGLRILDPARAVRTSLGDAVR